VELISVTVVGCVVYTWNHRRRGDKVVHVKIKPEEEGLAVEGGEAFATLSEVIESYANGYNTLTEKNGREIPLKQPLSCSDPTNER